MAEQYICFVDTENYAYEWGLLSDIEHQENPGFVKNPTLINLLNQKEIKNITAGPDFILSDTIVRELEVTFNLQRTQMRKERFIWEIPQIMYF